ncbi:MAG: helix-turn-helix domain-containing protein [Armatimonadetes bacterium]|nr:helix-turn-helix domain-containing protein [Armatimonadota bacterium]
MRLLDWYRHLSNQAERVKTKKPDGAEPEAELIAEKSEARLPSSTSEPRPMVRPMSKTVQETEPPAREEAASQKPLETPDPQPMKIADISGGPVTSEPRGEVQSDRSAPRFDEIEMPELDDFFTGRRRLEARSIEQDVSALATVPMPSSSGAVRPMASPPSKAEPERKSEIAPKPEPVQPEQKERIPGTNGGSASAKSEPPKPEEAVPLSQGIFDAPKQLQWLASIQGKEVAQNSYRKSFKESRQELIQRLIDPPLTLEEVARLLDVCPTTVRRYSNRGLLKHYRTVGNQRRFRLSDVMELIESQQVRRAASSVKSESAQAEEKTPVGVA